MLGDSKCQGLIFVRSIREGELIPPASVRQALKSNTDEMAAQREPNRGALRSNSFLEDAGQNTDILTTLRFKPPKVVLIGILTSQCNKQIDLTNSGNVAEGTMAALRF